MKTLIIEDGVVVNIAAGETNSIPPQGTEYKSVDDNLFVNIGWLVNGVTYVDPNPQPIPPTPEPSPQWVEFNNALLADAAWGALSEQLPVQILIGIVSASVAGNPASLQFALDTAKTVMASLGTPIPVEALADWQVIADLHNIPIIF